MITDHESLEEMIETTTIVIKNPYPKSMSRMADIIDYCADRVGSGRWTLGEELSLLFSDGDATALDACNFYIDALNETVDEVAWYSLDSDNNLTVTRPTEEEN